MKLITKATNATADDWINTREFFIERDLLKVTNYSNNWGDTYCITDVKNALRHGKECVEYTIKAKSEKRLVYHLLFEIGDVKHLFDYCESLIFPKCEYGGFYKVEDTHFEYYKTIHKSVRIYSPFNLHYVKPLKAVPKKWTLTHVVRCITNKQYKDLKCNGVYTDDYAYDAAYDFQRGNLDGLSFIQKIIESPSGWWAGANGEKVSICCHSFDSNSFIPNI